MSFSTLARTVLDPDLCTRCGMCAVACPEQIIAIDKTLRPALTEAESRCGGCDECSQVCPGARTGTPQLEQRLFGRLRKPEERWLGVYRTCHGGRATDPTVFERSGSGGSVTTLLAASFRALSVDAALVAGRDALEGWRAAPSVCGDPSQLSRHAQSTYQLSTYLAPLRGLLMGEKAVRVAVAGLPCHVQAIRKLQGRPTALGQRARERIALVVEVACSSNTIPSGTSDFIAKEMGLDIREVADVRYRDGDYPGEFVAVLRDGRKVGAPVWQAIRYFKGHKTNRCLTCGDWLSGLGDISVCDGDPNIFAASQNGSSAHGKHGTILVRTDAGERVFGAAVAAGELEAWPKTIEDTNLGLLRKRNRRCFYESAGVTVPDGPIPGYQENIEVVSDDTFVPDLGGKREEVAA